MISISSVPFSLSPAGTTLDSESNAMLKDHAYRAQNHGRVDAKVIASGGNKDIFGYKGPTSDPAGAGVLIQSDTITEISKRACIGFLVAKGQYFEVKTDSTNAITIIWSSFGPLQAPIDYN